MSKIQAMYAMMKVVAEKTGKGMNKMFQTNVDDLTVKAADIAKVVDPKDAEARIRQTGAYFNYIEQSIDSVVNQRMSEFKTDIERIKNDDTLTKSFIKKVNSRTGAEVTPEDFKDIKKLNSRIKDSIEKKELDRYTGDWVAELHGYGGVDRISEIISGATGKKMKEIKKHFEDGTIDKFINGLSLEDTRKVNKNVAVGVMVSRRVAGKTLMDVNKFGTIDHVTASISNKISSLAEVFKKNGNEFGYNMCVKTHSFIRNASALELAVNKAAQNFGDFSKMPVEKQRAIASYIEKRRRPALDNPVPVPGDDGINKLVEMDQEVAGQLGLTDNEIMFANKLGNFDRIMRKMESGRLNAKTGKDLEDNLQESVGYLDNLPGDTVLFKDENFSNPYYGDLGINHFPISITDEHKERVVAAIEKENPGIYDFSTYTGKQSAYQRARRIGSVANMDANRRPASEEFGRYVDSFLDSNTRQAGNAYIKEIGRHATQFDLMNKSSKLVDKDYYPAYKSMIGNLEESWNNIYHAQTKPGNVFTKSIAGLTDVNTSVALGQNVTSLLDLVTGDVAAFAQGQRMGLFNFLEFIPTTTAMKGILPTLAGLKDSPSYVKAYLQAVKSNGGFKKMFNPANTEMAIELVKGKIKDPVVKKAWNDYWKYESPDILMESFYSMDSNVQKIMQSVTTVFKMADVAARNVAIATSSVFAKRHWTNNAESIMAGDAKAIDKLIKDTHLFEFDHLDREYILEASKNMPEFVSRFARISTRYELFNYSKYFRPELLDKAKKNWLAARATRFLSWNMYYGNYLRGVVRAHENGDSEPMKRLGKMAAVWFTTMSATQRIDDETVNAYASYGLGRTPFVGPAIGVATTNFRELTGIVAPSFATVAGAGIWTADAISDLLSGNEGKKDSFDYAWEKSYDSIKRQPVLRPLLNAYDNIFGEEK